MHFRLVSGGATRLEIIRDFRSGGLTPSEQVVEEILGAVRIPARVMLRERDDSAIAAPQELERLCSHARQLAKYPLDGFVLGFMRAGRVDLETTRAIFQCAPAVHATFHHAFEEASSPVEAISHLKTLPQIDRILTHGGHGPWEERIRRLDEYQRLAQPQMEILAGGGLTLERVTSIREKTHVREFHVGTGVRSPQDSSGTVVSSKVREFSTLLEAQRKLSRPVAVPCPLRPHRMFVSRGSVVA